MNKCEHIDHIRFGPTEESKQEFERDRSVFVDRLVAAIKKQMEEESMPILRCKMRVQSVSHYLNEDGSTNQEEVKLMAVYGADGTDNAQWSKWTPSANFSITINNPEAFNKLSKGHEFYVDFTPAEAEVKAATA